MGATVEIMDVFADAIKVTAAEIQAGDYVFTTHGERIRIKRATKRNQYVKITRVDGWVDHLGASETITIVRGTTA